MTFFHKMLSTNAPAAVILIRLIVGGVFLTEGIQKFLLPEALGVGRFTKIGIPNPEIMAPFVGVCEVIAGLLLLINRFAPFALTVLAAIIVNIIVVDVVVVPKALPVGAVVTILWILAAYRVRAAFLPLLQQRAAE